MKVTRGINRYIHDPAHWELEYFGYMVTLCGVPCAAIEATPCGEPTFADDDAAWLKGCYNYFADAANDFNER